MKPIVVFDSDEIRGRIIALRGLHNLKQYEFAEILGMNPVNYSAFEREARDDRYKALPITKAIIASLKFNKPLDYFYPIDKEKTLLPIHYQGKGNEVKDDADQLKQRTSELSRINILAEELLEVKNKQIEELKKENLLLKGQLENLLKTKNSHKK